MDKTKALKALTAILLAAGIILNITFYLTGDRVQGALSFYTFFAALILLVYTLLPSATGVPQSELDENPG
jgi:uncharacterized membrane protein